MINSRAAAEYYASNAWQNTWYCGMQTLKCPLDLWVYHEIIYRVKPRLIVETGTWDCGSAAFMADALGAAGVDGEVVTIDVAPRRVLQRARMRQVIGSSTDPKVVHDIATAAACGGAVLVVLDSEHAADHVHAELEAYARLVTVGSYIIVEDTNIGGPEEAVRRWLPAHPEFAIDHDCEKFGITFNPGGYLRRTA